MGQPGATSPTEPLELTQEQRTTVRGSINRIRAQAETLLPTEYEVGTEVEQTEQGPSYSIAVFPPIGYPVSVKINLMSMAEQTDEGPKVDLETLDFDPSECEEVAQQLVASAILQVKQAEEASNEDPDLPAS